MSEDFTRKVVAWATETGRYAADLPSRQAREAYFAARYRELVEGATAEGAMRSDAVVLADACVDAARRIMIELLATRAGAPRGQA